MKQTVIDWYKRNGFNFWKIENSKGKTIADNTAGKSKEDGEATRLSVELEALERLNITERYTVSGMVKNGHDWSSYPFHTTPSAFGGVGSGGNSGIMEMAMMFGRMQSDNTNQMIIWQLQQEKAERDRKEAERMTFAKIIDGIKPILPMLAPVAVNGLFGLAEKSPAIQKSLATLLANPQVTNFIATMMAGMAQEQQTTQDYSNEQGTGIELETD